MLAAIPAGRALFLPSPRTKFAAPPFSAASPLPHRLPFSRTPAGLYPCGFVPLQACTPAGLYPCGFVPLQACTPAGLYPCKPVSRQACTPAGLYPGRPVPRRACIPAGLYPGRSVPRQACALTGLCPDRPVPLRACAPAGLYPCGFVPLRACTPAGLCPCRPVPLQACTLAGLYPDRLVPLVGLYSGGPVPPTLKINHICPFQPRIEPFSRVVVLQAACLCKRPTFRPCIQAFSCKKATQKKSEAANRCSPVSDARQSRNMREDAALAPLLLFSFKIYLCGREAGFLFLRAII